MTQPIPGWPASLGSTGAHCTRLVLLEHIRRITRALLSTDAAAITGLAITGRTTLDIHRARTRHTDPRGRDVAYRVGGWLPSADRR